MDTVLQLKNKIIQRVLQIDDINLLKSIEYLFSTSNANLSKFLSFANDRLQNENSNESENSDDIDNYNDYIKEWVKNM
ncbi:hypothetical protein [Lutibacter sp. B1]|uniref:hypothetical protein n=1 Tax=Lutibacter sp. B1 TaxID=2725996 RepID=UPI0014573C02|nr:hypothetical protein [Lutibacter sp. B1]NLP58599.1 hypothetical protein [Lutibacter sp. B1]